MNNIQTNTALFVNILSMSRTSEVQKWDHEAFQRAFRWAHYFEQVHKKTKSKQNVAEKISHHLSEACSNVGSRLGLSPLLYSDLPNSTNILRKNLLENSSITNDFYLQLVEQFNAQAEGEETMKNQLHSLSKLKATLQILQLIQKRFELLSTSDDEKDSSSDSCEKGDKDSDVDEKENDDSSNENVKYEVKENDSSLVKSQITANAVLLRKCLQNVIAQAPSLCNEKKSQLHKKLSNMVKHERGIDVLLLALICEEKDDMVSAYIIQFIKDILVGKWKTNWKLFLQLPLSKLFGQSSALFKDFMELYLDLLQNCGDNLQKEIEANSCLLTMDMVEPESEKQMFKYYFYLLQNFLIALVQPSPQNELQVEFFIRTNCDKVPTSIPVEANVWKKLSQEMMLATAM